jgi:hypothetical protein
MSYPNNNPPGNVLSGRDLAEVFYHLNLAGGGFENASVIKALGSMICLVADISFALVLSLH